jgi:uncharacterized protein (TIGR03437 family)
VGTGEIDTFGYGSGVLKSTDAGATWTQLTGPFVGPYNEYRSGANIQALAVSPTNPQVVLAAVDYGGALVAKSGIFRSTDGGVTWTQVIAGGAGTDLVFDPSRPNVVYAGLGAGALQNAFGGGPIDGVYKSTDGGATFTQLKSGLPTANVGRVTLALAKSAPDTLYTAIQDASNARFGSLLGLYRSTDGGQSWTQIFTIPDFCTPQCWYAMPIAVHPTNANLVLAGGLFLYRSLNGGASWTNIYAGDGNPLHADLHSIAFTPDVASTYIGTDGGVYVTSAISQATVTWSDRNDTLNTIQFYAGISIHPTDPNITLGGTQDNGTILYSGNRRWDLVVGGDGGHTLIDSTIPDITYVTVNNSLRKIGLGNYRQYLNVLFGIGLMDRGFNVNAPTVMDPANPQRLYLGTYRIYQTNDGAGSWRVISPDLTGGATSAGVITAIAAAPSSTDVVYVGTYDSRVHVTANANQGPDAQWSNISSGLPATRAVGSIVVDPIDAQTAYVGFQGFSGFGDKLGHVFKATSPGKWTDISGNLPNIPVNALAIDPDVPGTLYAGTDMGMFVTRDGGATWAPLMSGFPRVMVMDLVVHRPSRILRAATYGRGMWDLQLPPVASQRPAITSLSQSSVASGSDDLILTVSGANFAPGSTLRWNGNFRPTGVHNSSELAALIPASDLAGAGRATITVFSPVAGGGFSNAVNFTVGGSPTVAPGGITNGANVFSVSALSPGSPATVYGTDLAPRTIVTATPASTSSAVNAPLPFSLGDVSVELSDGPVSLFYVSPTQIGFQVPWGLQSYATTNLVVRNGTQKSTEIPVTLTTYAPVLYSTNDKGTGQGTITIVGAPNTLAAPKGALLDSRPAKKGEVVAIFASGLGPVADVNGGGPSNGLPQAAAPARLARIPIVTIGGVQAVVRFAGLAAGKIGIYEVDVEVPQTASAGDAIPVVLTTGAPPLGSFTSNTVTMAVE